MFESFFPHYNMWIITIYLIQWKQIHILTLWKPCCSYSKPWSIVVLQGWRGVLQPVALSFHLFQAVFERSSQQQQQQKDCSPLWSAGTAPWLKHRHPVRLLPSAAFAHSNSLLSCANSSMANSRKLSSLNAFSWEMWPLWERRGSSCDNKWKHTYLSTIRIQTRVFVLIQLCALISLNRFLQI